LTGAASLRGTVQKGCTQIVKPFCAELPVHVTPREEAVDGL
jgi:hypothetical protein